MKQNERDLGHEESTHQVCSTCDRAQPRYPAREFRDGSVISQVGPHDTGEKFGTRESTERAVRNAILLAEHSNEGGDR